MFDKHTWFFCSGISHHSTKNRFNRNTVSYLLECMCERIAFFRVDAIILVY